MKTLKLLVSLGIFFIFTFALPSFAEVNLNTASQSELEALPGVGKKLADAIIEHRPFAKVDDLKDVKGVGDAKFSKLKSMVTVGEREEPSATTSNKPTYSQPQNSRPTASSMSKLSVGERVSLNNASVEQLEKLPGIGPKKAQAIIQARPFSTVEDVMKVKGIKAGIFAKIKDNITL